MPKPFDPNIGKNTRWRKGGPSPNPGGRPKYRVVSEFLRETLSAGDAEKIGRSLLKKAKAGEMRAIVEVIDRTEGRAPQSVEPSKEDQCQNSLDYRSMSKEELTTRLVEGGIASFEKALESLDFSYNDLKEPLRMHTEKLQELHEHLGVLIRNLNTSGTRSLSAQGIQTATDLA